VDTMSIKGGSGGKKALTRAMNFAAKSATGKSNKRKVELFKGGRSLDFEKGVVGGEAGLPSPSVSEN